MAHDSDPREDPIVKPHLIRFAKNRPKLINIKARQEFLENLEENVCQRRCPPEVSDRVSTTMTRSGEQALQPVVRNTVASRLERANERMLNRL